MCKGIGERPRALILIILFFFIVGIDAFAQQPISGAPSRRIGLVLAGGGALGFAHVGVLKVLEEQRIAVHLVTGTSMGAIVGAAYAAGRGVDEMQSILADTDWNALFKESVSRRSVPYRLKAGRQREIYGDVKLGFHDEGLALPGGVIQGQEILPTLQRLYATVPSPVVFDDMPLPFRAVAADIATGQAYIPDRGDLATIVRASMSVPALFAPVSFDDKLLVDGGIANNLPIDEALKLGADQLIVVELAAELKDRKALEASPLAVTGQVISLLLAQNATLQKKLLRPGDVIIEPNLTGYSAADFEKGAELIALGEAAARNLIPQLKSFALPEEEYAQYQKQRRRSAQHNFVIDAVEVSSSNELLAASIAKSLPLSKGQVFDRSQVEREVQKLYQTGQYSEVRYDFYERNGQNVLVLKAEPKAWHKQFMQVGLAIEENFQGGSDYRLGGHYRFAELNDAGGSFDIDGEIGRSPHLSGELYQPISAQSRFFIAPLAEFGRSQARVRQDDDVVAEYERAVRYVMLRAGRELGHSGELYAGVARGKGDLSRDIGDQSLPEFDYDIGNVQVAMEIDDLDKPDFPEEGTFFNVQWRSDSKELGSSDNFEAVSALLVKPFTLGRNTLILGGSSAVTFQNRPVERSYALGGFFNVSGFESRSLLASDYILGRAIFFHRFAELKLPLFGFDFFAGGSYEVARLQSDLQAIPDEPLINAGSVFLGADTPLLPAYIGFGFNDEHEHMIYFALGRLDSGRPF